MPTVPDLRGLNFFTEAPAAYAAAGFTGVVTRLALGRSKLEYAATGIIKAQSEAPGSVISADRAIGIAQSSGKFVPALEWIPYSVVNFDLGVATWRVEGLRPFLVGDVTDEYHDAVPAGFVISSNPAIDGVTAFPEGSEFDLVISLGPAPPVEVPDVVGETQGDATTELEGDGFVVAVRRVYSAAVTTGNVVSQQPEGGTFAAGGATVTIFVSRGPAPEPTDLVVVHKTSGIAQEDCLGGEVSPAQYFSYDPRIVENNIPWLEILAIGYGEGIQQFLLETNEDLTGIRLAAQTPYGKVYGDAALFDAWPSAPFVLRFAFDENFWVQVGGTPPETAISGTLSFEPVMHLNGPVGHGESEAAQRVSGLTRYSCVALRALAPCFLRDVAVGGLVTGVWIEGYGAISTQVVADDETEPTGASGNWVDDVTGAELEIPEGIVVLVWIRTEHTSGDAVGFHKNIVTFGFDFGEELGGPAASISLVGGCWLADSALAGYTVYQANDEGETLGGAYIGFGSTLPMSLPCTLPETGQRVDRFRVCRRNKYGLETLERLLDLNVTVDAEGETATPPAMPMVSAVDAGGGMIAVTASWQQGLSGPASAFVVTATPDDGTAIKISVSPFFVSPGSSANITRTIPVGPFAWETTVALEVVTQGDAESDAWEGLVTVLSVAAQGNAPMVSSARTRDYRATLARITQDYGNGFKVIADARLLRMTLADADVFVFRLLDGGFTYYPGVALTSGLPLDTQSADAVVDLVGEKVTLAAGGVIVAELDLTDGTLTLNNDIGEAAYECPLPGPLVFTSNALWFQIFDVDTNKWKSLLQLTKAGKVNLI